MQAVWRWLWDAKHAVLKDERKPLMQGFRRVLYATTEVEAEALYEDLLQSAEDYENFQSYVQALWERRQSWCMAWRNIASMRGHHTNNYAEVTVHDVEEAESLYSCRPHNIKGSAFCS